MIKFFLQGGDLMGNDIIDKKKKANAIKKTRNGVVRAKSDFFRTARYGLNIQEYRIIYYAILSGQQNKTPFEAVTLSIQDFMKLFKLKGESSYSYIRKLSKEMVGRTVEVAYKDEKGHHLMQVPWLSAITYHVREGTVTIKLNKELQPFFEGKPFTDTEYYFLIQFTSQYSERLYEILKSTAWEKKPIVDFDIDDIRKRLGLQENQYKNYKDFRIRVLEPAIKDINEFTDLEVTFKEQRGYRNKVEVLFFSVTKKKKYVLEQVKRSELIKPPLDPEEQERLLCKLLGENYGEGDYIYLIDKLKRLEELEEEYE